MTLPPAPPELRLLAYVLGVNGAIALLGLAIWTSETDRSADGGIGCPMEPPSAWHDDPEEEPYCTSAPPARCAAIPVDRTLVARVSECARPLEGCVAASTVELVLEIASTGGLADVSVEGDPTASACVRRRLQHLRFEPGLDDLVVSIRVPVDDRRPPRDPGPEWTPRKPRFSHGRCEHGRMRHQRPYEWCRTETPDSLPSEIRTELRCHAP